MGAVANSFPSDQRGRVDFGAVRRSADRSLSSIVRRYLPSGKQEGDEWVSLNPTRGDNNPGSFKVNLKSGQWADFATGDKGGDVIDLVSYLKRTSKLDAAKELANLLGVAPGEGATTLTGNVRPVSAPVTSVSVASPAAFKVAPESFPQRTKPNEEGKPRFIKAGDEGPRVRDDEKRRHYYRRGDVVVRIKVMRRGDAKPFNIYRVTNGSDIGWQYAKPDGYEAVPYTLRDGQNPFEAEGLLFWTEGEKDTETVAGLGLNAFTFGGTGDGVPEGCEQYVVGRDVVILADNDEAGRQHAEKKAAVAHGVANSVRVIHFPELPEKFDVSDFIEAGGTAEAILQRVEECTLWSPPVEEAQADGESLPLPAPIDERFKLPSGYRFHHDGLYFYDPAAESDVPPIRLSSPFDVEAETRDGDSSSWGLLLRWVDHDGREHRLAVPRASLAGDGADARRTLLDGGMFISPGQKARNLFNAFLLQVRSPVRSRAVQRIGWHGSAYVLPDDCYGASRSESYLLQTATAHEHTFRQHGTLADWQKSVARYAVGNSRLILALSAAFAGPLVGPCDAEGGGLHFRGASSTGKSTALYVGGSVWGGGGGVNDFVRSWRATANGLEGVASAHSDALLCLDELSQLAARDAGEAAYMLSNGSGKSRSTRDGSARKPARWRVLFLSSGEIGLADKIAEDGRGRKMAAGQHVRIVDISADAGAGMGMFETLHGFGSADEFAQHLKAAAQANYGAAAREYLTAIVPDIDGVKQAVRDIISGFVDQYVASGADGQVSRVAQRFGLIAAGGELATSVGILPWNRGDAVAAAGKCFEDWIALRGGIEPTEAREGVEQVRAFLMANGMARFIPAWEDGEGASRIPMRDVAGYRRREGDGWDYFITGPAWKEEVCRGMDARRVASVMKQKGHLLTDDGPHLGKLVRVPDHGRLRLYHVPVSFLEDAQ